MVSFKTSASANIAVDKLTRDVLDRLDAEIQSRSLKIDCNLDAVSAVVDPNLIEPAISILIESALETTPDGGDVDVTLVGYCEYWELEVANSIRAGFEKRGNGVEPESPNVKSSCVGIVDKAAIAHGGKFTTCKNPLGGVAQVIAIPKHRIPDR